jgi:regulator of protease activity HflC (stomatin/prohibitin superfamily)
MEKPNDRKLQQRITRRKEKIQRMIEYLENRLIALDSVVFLRQEDQQKALARVFNKLNKLKQELRILESGRLPGSFGYYQPEE